jgi:hypothetical protein
MVVVKMVELRALMAERDALERERRCLVDNLREAAALDDVTARLREFTTRLASFAQQLRVTLGT